MRKKKERGFGGVPPIGSYQHEKSADEAVERAALSQSCDESEEDSPCASYDGHAEMLDTLCDCILCIPECCGGLGVATPDSDSSDDAN